MPRLLIEQSQDAPANPLTQKAAGGPKTGLKALVTDQAAPVSRSRYCPQHPGVPVAYVCQGCLSKCCSACVKEIRTGVRTFYTCPVCSGICVSLAAENQVVPLVTSSFPALAPDAFAYPLRKGGLGLLVFGALLFSFLEWAYSRLDFLPQINEGTWLIVLAPFLGYGFSALQNIILASAQGAEAPPGWPEFTHVWDDIVLPFLHGLSLFVFCLGPGLAAMYWINFNVGAALLVLGLFGVPMALLTVPLADGIRGLNPALLLSAIAKAPGAYLLVWLVLMAVVAVSGGLKYGATYVKLPLLSSLPEYFAIIYGLAVVTRMMGLFYRKYRDRFAGAS